ncbi:MAG: NAD(P)/FAD-dependent oxidoreductase [Actinomycetota bacterium]
MNQPIPPWDAIVIGGGPAGLSAATWLARYRRKVLVLDSEQHRNRDVVEGHGYFGLGDFSPAELLEQGRKHVSAYPTAELRRARVATARTHGTERFTLTLDDGDELHARRLVLATGVRDELPDIPGFVEHYGASAFHCPTCDGYEAREQRVLVVGWSELVAGFALNLLDWARTVTVVTDGRRFEGDDEQRWVLAEEGVELLEDEVVELVGVRGALEGARLRGGRAVDCELVFFTIAHNQSSDLADQLGCQRSPENDCVVVDENNETSVAGVYAAGDMTPGMQLVQIAAAKGATAGITCAQSIRGEPPAPGAPEPGPDPAVAEQS